MEGSKRDMPILDQELFANHCGCKLASALFEVVLDCIGQFERIVYYDEDACVFFVAQGDIFVHLQAENNLFSQVNMLTQKFKSFATTGFLFFFVELPP